MSISIAICDDEKNIQKEIMNLVKNQWKDSRLDLYDSGDALLAANIEYDVYFLDIQMPGISGMETAKQLRERQEAGTRSESVIIFVTALKEYMADAFDVKAFHYLIKPIDENKLKTVFSRAISDLCKIKENAENYILIKSGNSHHKLFFKDIFYVESHDKKVIINSINGTIEYYGKMREIENTLGRSFFRCHRCYIVNMEHITRYNATSIWVKNGKEIYLAQKKYSVFVKSYMQFSLN